MLLIVPKILSLCVALAVAPPLKAQIASAPEVERGKSAGRDTLFGIRLSPKARKVQRRVEALYGMPVRQYPPTQEGLPVEQSLSTAFVEMDGRPAVSIKTASELREDVIVHELHHLIMTAEGRPVIHFLTDDQVDASGLQDLLLQIISNHVISPVDHAAFYPRMRSLGYDPDAEMRRFLAGALGRPAPRGPGESVLIKPFYAGLYFDLLLTVNSRTLRADVETHARSNGLEECLARARRMVAIYSEARPVKSRLWLPYIVKLLNEAFDGVFAFSVLGEGVSRRGKVDYRSATLRITIHPALLKAAMPAHVLNHHRRRSHFSQLFRRETGLSPSDYRRQR